MIRSFAAALLLLLSPSLAFAVPTIGQPAPKFSTLDSNGKMRSLSDFKGKIVVLEWTNDGCPYVRKHYGSGNMQKVQQDLTSQCHWQPSQRTDQITQRPPNSRSL
jgi:hypothetical protein